MGGSLAARREIVGVCRRLYDGGLIAAPEGNISVRAATAGPSLLIAHQRMESLEHAAHIMLIARLLGRVIELSPADGAALVAARERAKTLRAAFRVALPGSRGRHL